MLDQLPSEIAYLRTTLDAEIEARRRADHLVAGMIDDRRDLLRQLATGSEQRRDSDATATVEDAPTTQNTASLSDDVDTTISTSAIGCGG